MSKRLMRFQQNPSLLSPHILAGLFLILIFVSSIHTFIGLTQDFGLHLRLGQIIWQEHIIPTTNYFSYTAPDFNWGNDYWLSKVVMYLGFVSVGMRGLILLTALLWTMTFALSLFAYPKRESFVISCAASILPVFMIFNRTAVRPEMFSFLLLSAYLFLLFRDNRKLFWLLPILQLIWVNTHIYFILGLAIYSLYLVVNYYKTKQLDKQLLFIGLLMFLVDFISPYGFKGAFYPLLVFQNYGMTIFENLSPFSALTFDFYGPFTIIVFFISAFVSAIALALNYKNFKNNLFENGILLMSLILSLQMIRNFPIFALISIPITSKNFYESGALLRIRKAIVIVGLILVLSIYLFVSSTIYSWAMIKIKFGLIIPKEPTMALDFIKKNNLKGPIFNNGLIGSYLIWRLPEEKVFMDTRPEAYPSDFLQNVYIPMQADPSQWKIYSDKYKINYVLFSYHEKTDWAHSFIKNMANNLEWPLVYGDSAIVIFAKNNEQNKKIIQQTKEFREHTHLAPIESPLN